MRCGFEQGYDGANLEFIAFINLIHIWCIFASNHKQWQDKVSLLQSQMMNG